MLPGIILTVIGAIIVLGIFVQACTIGIPVVYGGYYIALFAVGAVILIIGVVLLIVKSRSKSKKTKAKGAPFPFKNYTINIVSGCIGAALIIGIALLWSWICSFMYEGHEPENIFGYLNIIPIAASAFIYIFLGILLITHDFSHPVFSGYHPTGKTITETKAFLRRAYFEKGLVKELTRIAVIFSLIYIGILIVMTVIDLYNISLLLPSPILFLGISVIWSDEKYDEFIAERANCKGWREFVCKYCETLISGKALESSEHREGESTYHHDREITTTTTTTTSSDWMMIGNTEYIDTRVDTRVDTVVDDQEYIKTDHFDFYHYRCPRCKKIHTVSRTYTTRMDL